jgi:glycogen debranching enzyme
MATMIATYNYYLFTGDDALMQEITPNYLRALQYITSKIDNSTGMLSVTGTDDWGRINQGGRNTEANMLMYLLFENCLVNVQTRH